jgi:hypothetical protein
MKISIITYSLMWLRKLRKFWKFGVSRSSERVLGDVPPVTTRLNVFSWSIVNSNSDSEHIEFTFYVLRITWIYLKIYWKSTWNSSWAISRGCCTPPSFTPPVATALCMVVIFHICMGALHLRWSNAGNKILLNMRWNQILLQVAAILLLILLQL